MATRELDFRAFNAKPNVLLYVPNIIIYARLALLLIAMFTFFKWPRVTFVIYFISASLDSVDGLIAKLCKQTSRTGALFDMALDRVSTAFILIGLSILYPHLWWLYCSACLLDIASHFARLHACVFTNSDNHKTVGYEQNKILKWYYGRNRLFSLFNCLTHDLWIGFCYLYYYFPTKGMLLGIILMTPGFLLKSYIHVLQFISSVQATLACDEQGSV